jgi:hypothetical protein
MKQFIYFLALLPIIALCLGLRFDNELQWKEGYRLQPSDFLTVNSLPDDKLAEIYTGISYKEFRTRTGKIKGFEVHAVCDRSKSFMLEKVKKGYHLKRIIDHEQGHFDLTEYITRKLRQRLENCTNSELAESIYYDHLTLMDELQQLYDSQTDHGRDEDLQKKWDLKIRQYLFSTKHK